MGPLVAVSAAHGRHAITRAWAEHVRNLGLPCVVAITEGDETLLDILNPWHTATEAPNEPLGAKFNTALDCALFWYPDLTRIMILPSDDFVSPAWVKAAREHPGDYLYPHCCGIVDAETQAAYVITKLSFGTLKYGAGRVVSRRVIDKLEGQLWPQELNKGLDGASHQRITKAGFEVQVVKTEGIPITDVKTAENLWPFKSWRDSGTPITVDAALHMVSPAVRAQLDSLKK
jgi:hypothetical protein